jgi:hypothetical protein
MQLRIPLWRPIAAALFATPLLGLPACDGGDPDREAKSVAPLDSMAVDEAPKRSAAPGDLDGIRDRADAAFAAMEGPSSRSESRIGPQPWPADLPARWPRLEEGRVLADLRRDGDRLLLVDWPGDADGAFDRFDAALRAEGFDVVSGQGGGAGSLSARDATTTAELTFFPRETVTRVEILFREREAG